MKDRIVRAGRLVRLVARHQRQIGRYAKAHRVFQPGLVIGEGAVLAPPLPGVHQRAQRQPRLASADLKLLLQRRGGAPSQGSRGGARLAAHPLGQLLIHQRQADFILGRVQQMLQGLKFTEHMQRTGEKMDGGEGSRPSLRYVPSQASLAFFSRKSSLRLT